MSASALILDVREDIRHGREPFSRIMGAIGKLAAGEELVLIAPFEPVPLFHVLAKQGCTHKTEKKANGDWEVRIRRESSPIATLNADAPKAEGSGAAAPGRATKVIQLDARGLEPPQPLVMILEALSSLSDGAEMSALTDRRPMHLYPQLEERGFSGQTEETEDGSFVTHIRRH
jgi:uncharacterized protein (DUF2249 family)